MEKGSPFATSPSWDHALLASLVCSVPPGPRVLFLEVNATEKSYKAILENIRTQELRPGDKLTTRTLAEVIGVSLSPFRDATTRLATSEMQLEHWQELVAIRQELIAALANRDKEGARAATEKQLEASHQRLVRAIDSRQQTQT